jgi:probable F420-dependent oxidoreductase
VKIGVVYPQYELGCDADLVSDYTQQAADLGFDHILAFDHVLGADRNRRRSWKGSFGVDDEFLEPLVLFAFMAGKATIDLMTGVLILPQRQTALVAKQAATLDVLSGGRLRLGVGLGWNDLEYEALGRDFHQRGAMLEKQIQLLRKLWVDRIVDEPGVAGEQAIGVGIAPRPVQRPIPVWIGSGHSERALQRVGRLADGFVAQDSPGPDLKRCLEIISESARRASRDPDAIGLQGLVRVGELGGDRGVVESVDQWAKYGATHLAVYTTRKGLRGSQHIREIARLADLLAPHMHDMSTTLNNNA